MAEVLDEIDRVPPAELIPYSNNAKEHPEEQVKKIASSIKNYGWDQPIVVDGENEIIKGHGRLQAAELLGLSEVPVIRREDLTEAEAKASRIADNKTAESAWIDDVLETEIDILAQEDEIEMDSLGFDDDEIDDLLQPDDALPEPAEEEALGLEAEYEVIIECNDELEQERVYDELTTEGYECRLNSL
jgi:ParB-like chromosome segregation protein Spo0J